MSAPSHHLIAGLRVGAFSESDAAHFHGRSRQVQRLHERLQRDSRFLALVGPVGSGKTSLVRAGLIADLQQRHGTSFAVLHIEHPGLEPMHRLVQQGLQHPFEGLTSALTSWLAQRRAVQRVLLLVDHAEELGGIASSRVRDLFLQQLTQLIGALPALSVVLVVREDRLAQLTAAAPALVPWLESGAVYLPPTLERDEWTAMLHAPAVAQGVTVEPALVEAIAHDLSELHGELKKGQRAGASLVHLGFTVNALLQRRQGSVLRVSDYQALGGVAQALAQWAATQWASLTATQQEQARPLLLELVHIGAEGTLTLSQPRALKAGDAAENAGAARWEFLAARGLVRIDPAQQLVELAHATLLTDWAELVRWQQDERRFAQWHHSVSSLAFRFASDTAEHGNAIGSQTLSPEELREAAGWLKQRPQQISAPVQQLFEAQRPQLPQPPPDAPSVPLQTTRAAVPSVVPTSTIPLPPGAPPAEVEVRLPAAAPGAQLLWIGLAAALVALLLTLRWHWREQAVNLGALRSEQAARAALLVHQPGRDGEALRLAIESVASSLRQGLQPSPAVREGLMVVLSVARNSVAMYGHEDQVNLVVHSPDGKRVATAGHDKTVRLWDAQSGQPLQTLRGHHDGIAAIAFSPDGRTLLSASADGTARLWNADTGAPLRTLQDHHAAVTTAAFSADGARIVTGCKDGAVYLWRTDSGALITKLSGHNDEISATEFSHDGTLLLTASHDGKAMLWDGKTAQLRTTFTAHTADINVAQLSPGGELIATASRDKTIRLWNPQGKEVAVLQPHGGSVWAVAFSPSGEFLASADVDGAVHLWNAHTGEHLAALSGHVDSVNTLGFTPDSNHLITGGFDRTVRIWTVHSPRPLAVLRGHAGNIFALSIAPAGDRVVTVSYDRTVRSWDLRPSMPVAVLPGHQGRVHHLAWGQDGSRIVTAGYDGIARLWQWPGAQLVRELKGHTRQLYRVAISDDGTRVATASADGTVRLWEGKSGLLVAVLQGHAGEVYGLAFSRDSARLFSTDEKGWVRIWDARSGVTRQAPVRVSQSSIEWIASAPDGRRLVTIDSDGEVLLLDATSLQQVGRLVSDRSALNTAVFVKHGVKYDLITASEDRTVRSWDADSGQPLRVVHTLPEGVLSAMPTGDGSRLVMVGKDRAIRIWDLKADAPVVELPILADGLYFAVYAPDGSHFAVVGSDGTAKIYRDEYSADLWGMTRNACLLLQYRPEYADVRADCLPFLQ